MKPLTIEELKALEVGDWVWMIQPECQGRYITKTYGNDSEFPVCDYTCKFLYTDYGTKWLAYKNKEMADSKGEIVELPCKVGEFIYVPYVHKGVSGIMKLPVNEIQIAKYSIVFCADFETDDIDFGIRFSNGLFLLDTYQDIWFTDKFQAEARLKELQGEE